MPPFLTRRALATTTTSLFLTRCASVPPAPDLTGRDIGLTNVRRPNARPAPDPPPSDDPAQLQQQYDIQLALSESPLVFGNKVTLLSDGQQGFAAFFQAISQATDSINLEYFILDNIVSGGVSLSDMLHQKLRAGVKVNMIYDSYGSRDTPADFFDQLRQAGARIIEFNPLDPFASHVGWAPNDRDHRKITVVDGRIGFTGGINMDKAYENPPSTGVPPDGNARKSYWRDVAIRIDGPAVAELQKLFFATWTDQKGPDVAPANYFPPLPRQGVQTIRIIGSSPGNKQPLYFASLMAAIGNARHRIWGCSGYFVPPHEEREALAKAASNGIDVRIITPAFSDVESAVFAARAAYGDLLEAGAKIYEIRDAVLHAKIAVVDDTWTVVGSSNLDRRSIVFNNEVDAVILGRDTAGQIEGVLRDYMQAAVPVDMEAWRHRPLREHIREMQARIWQYWM